MSGVSGLESTFGHPDTLDTYLGGCPANTSARVGDTVSFLAKWASPPKRDASAVERAETAPPGSEEDPAGSQTTQDANQDESRRQEVRKQKAAIVEHLSGSGRSGDTGPREQKFISSAEWQALEINRIFEEHGTGAQGRLITAEAIEARDVRSRWAERWPDKPFGEVRLKDGTLDPEIRDWVCERLRKGGTRFLVVNGKNSLACWPEQNAPEYRLALRLVDLDRLPTHSRDDPLIQKLLIQQHPGRP